MYDLTYYRTDWQETLEAAARDFINRPTKENRIEILTVLDIPEETLWEAVRQVIVKDHQEYEEYIRSGKADQYELKKALLELGSVNRHLTGTAREVMGKFWRDEISRVRTKIIKRVTGVRQPTGQSAQVR